jgi:hypothetical protein
MPGHPGGSFGRVLEPQLRQLAGMILSGRGILVILACGAMTVALLVPPVLNDASLEKISGPANRAAPKVLVAGICVLVAGLLTGWGVLDIIGGVLIAIVALAALAVHYLCTYAAGPGRFPE